MEYRTLEINVVSAKDLSKVNLFSKMDVYVVVSIEGEYHKSPNNKQKTNIDKDGDTHPSWNFPMKFTLDEAALQQNRLSLVFCVRCDRALGDKDIGEVHVPVKELLDSVGVGKLNRGSYQVRKPSGKPKGELTFSYKFGDKVVQSAPEPKAQHADEPVTAYPAAHPMPAIGSSSGYPYPPQSYGPPGGAYPPPTGAYPPPHDKYPAPPPVAANGYGGYPPPPPYAYGAYPPPPAGYGYPSQPGYGYPPVQQPPKKNSKLGLGLGAGLLGGALGGLLIGDMVSDAAAYDAGYEDAVLDGF